MNVELPEDLAEHLADRLGIYGACPGDHAEEEVVNCRPHFVSSMTTRIRESVRNEKVVSEFAVGRSKHRASAMLPCRCGSTDLGGYVQIHCRKCGACGPHTNDGRNDAHADFADHMKAIELWNDWVRPSAPVDQPPGSGIFPVHFDKMEEITLTKTEFNNLLDYSHSVLTGVAVGKRWKGMIGDYWYLGEYIWEPDQTKYPGRIRAILKQITVVEDDAL